jgi:hypothetical protein
MKTWLLLALAAAVAATPARAGMTAVYASAGTKTAAMRVEIADDGRLRMEFGDGTFSLIRRDGRIYVVLGEGADRLVADIEDLRTVTRESGAKRDSATCEAFRPLAAEMKLVQRGSATIGGRSGDAWFRQNSNGTTPTKPDLVISHDPALAPLGTALAEGFGASISMLPQCPAFTEAMAPMQNALATGTPIAMQGLELLSLDTGPIDPHRFDLPAPPRTRAELRKGPKPGTPLVTLEARPKP